MVALLSSYISDRLVECVLVIVAAISTVSVSALIFGEIFKRRPTLQHTILIVGLLCCLIAPGLTVVMQGSGVFTFAFRLPRWANNQKIEVHTIDADAEASNTFGAVVDTEQRNPEVRNLSKAFRPSLLPDRLGKASKIESSPLGDPNAVGTSQEQSVVRTLLSAAIVAWLFGAAFLLSILGRATVTMARIRRCATPFRCPGLEGIEKEVARRLGCRLPRLLQSEQVRSPVAAGLFRASVIMPSGLINKIDRAQLCDVLTHECAHVVRLDPLALYLQSVAKCLFWPIPFVHLLNLRLSQTREEICDNYVIRDQDPIRYAETLLQIASMLRGSYRNSLAVGILHARGGLESRIASLIDIRRNTKVRTDRFTALLSVATFLAATVAVCGMTFQYADARESSDALTESVVTNKNHALEPIRIRVAWGISGNPLGDAFARQVKQFNKSQKEVVVEIERLVGYDSVFKAINEPAGANSLPDAAIVEIHSIAALAASHRIQSLDERVEQDATFQAKDLLPGILSNLRYQEEIVGLPFNRSTPVLYYNKDWFAKAGLDPDKPPETWQEMREFSRALKTDDAKQYGFLATNFPWAFESMVWSAGGQLTDGKRATFAKPGAKAMRIWSDMVHREGTARFGEHFTEKTEFIAGHAAMVIESTALLKWYTSTAPFKVGVAMLPRYEGFSNAVSTGGGAAVIPSGVTHERADAAWKFLTWLAETEQTADWSRATGYIPVRKSAEALLRKQRFYVDHPTFLTAVEEMKVAREAPQIPQWTSAWPIIQDAMAEILRDGKPPEDMLLRAEQSVDKLMQAGSR